LSGVTSPARKAIFAAHPQISCNDYTKRLNQDEFYPDYRAQTKPVERKPEKSVFANPPHFAQKSICENGTFSVILEADLLKLRRAEMTKKAPLSPLVAEMPPSAPQNAGGFRGFDPVEDTAS